MMSWNSILFHNPSSYLMEVVVSMHDYVMMFLMSILILVIYNIYSLFVLKFNSFEFFEDHQMEALWTVTPFVILILIVFPSLTSLYMLDTCLFCGITLNIVGHQWYWSYFYKDFLGMSFDSYMLSSETSNMRVLDVDNRVLIPSSIPARFLVTSADVIHSWTVPSFGVKMDAVPGRMNQFCFSPKRVGVFFGQCSEICGANHSFMPIVVECVNFSDFLKSFSVWFNSLF